MNAPLTWKSHLRRASLAPRLLVLLSLITLTACSLLRPRTETRTVVQTRVVRCRFVDPDIKESQSGIAARPPVGKEWEDVPAEQRCNFAICYDVDNILKVARFIKAYRDAHEINKANCAEVEIDDAQKP